MINKVFFFFLIFLIFNIANGNERSEKEIKLGVFLDDLENIGSFIKSKELQIKNLWKYL